MTSKSWSMQPFQYLLGVDINARYFFSVILSFRFRKTGLALTNRSERVFLCDTLSVAYWIQWLSSAVTWEHISHHVHDSVSNVPHLPAVNDRVQR